MSAKGCVVWGSKLPLRLVVSGQRRPHFLGELAELLGAEPRIGLGNVLHACIRTKGDLRNIKQKKDTLRSALSQLTNGLALVLPCCAPLEPCLASSWISSEVSVEVFLGVSNWVSNWVFFEVSSGVTGVSGGEGGCSALTFFGLLSSAWGREE